MAPSSSITQLSSIIANRCAEIDDFLKSANLPGPSLDLDAAPALPLPPQMQGLRVELLAAINELQGLVQGPMESLIQVLSPRMNIMPSIEALHKCNILPNIKVGEELSFDQLAVRCNLDENSLRQLMRLLISFNIFAEPRKGFVTHNAISKLLLDIPPMFQWLTYVCEEMWPCGPKTVDAMIAWPGAQELDQTAYYLAHGDTFWNMMKKNPERLQRFTTTMGFLQSLPNLSPDFLIAFLDWDSVGAPKLLVDVGGNDGTLDIRLLRKFPTMECIVQDLPDVINAAKTPEDLKGRLQFRAHDFFTPQPVKADAYLLRSVLHDWSDKYAMSIIKNLIPALQPGAKIYINEACMPDPRGTTDTNDQLLRGFDLYMKQVFNGKERHLEEWIALLASVDKRFKFEGVKLTPGSSLSLLTFSWEA